MQESIMNSMWGSSLFDGENAAYLENLYDIFLEDPKQLSEEWQLLFSKLPVVNRQSPEVSHTDIQELFRQIAKNTMGAMQPISGSADSEYQHKQTQVSRLIHAYRMQGHLLAKIDPLGLREACRENITELSLAKYDLGEQDMATVFDVGNVGGQQKMPLSTLCKLLNQFYCESIGTEYMHIASHEERTWIQERMEISEAGRSLSKARKEHILECLTAAEGLEKYLGVKFPGAKRFSLEGGDVLVPLLDELLQRAGSQGVRECVIGMSHRGRLNVLINILGKDPKELFDEFEGRHAATVESGDVKYHQGFSSDIKTSNANNLHLSLAFNPSHLEIVTPVVAGSAKARQLRAQDEDFNKVLPIALHGDAAFAGQGVVMETLNMSQTRGYGIGGTIHIVINNQVGFTTSNPYDARSTLYCTDVAKVVLAPIFHVNADDPEAVVFVTQCAFDYRAKFNKDVVIDLVCYRRHGHNEADDPFATQPVMYQIIKSRPTVRQLYADKLIQENTLSKEQPALLVKENRELLDKGACLVKNLVQDSKRSQVFDWSQYFSDEWREDAKTAIDAKKLNALAAKLLAYPQDFSLHSRVAKIYEDRAKMATGELAMDWGFAETMAYAALLEEGYSVRLSGQDSGRGTFFHRHVVLHDQKTGKAHIPLQHIADNRAKFTVIDSLLSEEAVLAFEYGFATTDPTSLVIWEAQFGDFANGAQVVMDQFISSGEQKWGRLCNLVMLLPHGYEGQGPEHSSARLERYLQLCAQHNIQVCVPTNATQIFHLLRRQMRRKTRKPLVIMSPKSLLRMKAASNDVSTLINGKFEVIIPEVQDLPAQKVSKVVLCSGKVYYDLFTKREEMQKNHIAIMRIEQLYPFPEPELKAALAKYPNANDVVWCQEEPKNQGAWFSSQHHIRACLSSKQQLQFAGRKASASTAVGYHQAHVEQQEALVHDALK